ncbi:hypothetical protein HOY82DRAFT_650481 [Tuber indicum]|nr:hypothetical protein HOY82DRAFT_650481 [Tuber indicum]
MDQNREQPIERQEAPQPEFPAMGQHMNAAMAEVNAAFEPVFPTVPGVPGEAGRPGQRFGRTTGWASVQGKVPGTVVRPVRSQGRTDWFEQAMRIANLPIVANGITVHNLQVDFRRDLQLVRQEIEQLQIAVHRHEQSIQQVEPSVHHREVDAQQLREEQALLPIRLYNSSARDRDNLVYPPTVRVSYPPLPRTRIELWQISDEQFDEAATYLGLVALQHRVQPHARPRQLADYLGIAHTFS